MSEEGGAKEWEVAATPAPAAAPASRAAGMRSSRAAGMQSSRAGGMQSTRGAQGFTEAQYKAAFAVFDTNGDGTLTPDELKAILMRPVGGQPSRFTDEMVDALIKQFDANGNGVLEHEEFSKAWASLATPETGATADSMMSLVFAPGPSTSAP